MNFGNKIQVPVEARLLVHCPDGIFVLKPCDDQESQMSQLSEVFVTYTQHLADGLTRITS